MEARGDEEDDDISNPFIMLLSDKADDNIDDDSKELSTVGEGSPNQQLLRQHLLRSINSTVVVRQIPSEGIAFQLWPAATTLVSLFDQHRCDPNKSPLSSTLSALTSRLNGDQLSIVELGSGTGIVGIAAAATLGAKVTVTDLPLAVPNMQFNAEANSGVLAANGGAVQVAPLRWGQTSDANLIEREFDLILGTDIVYHEHLFDPLLETLRLLLLNEGEGEIHRRERVFVMAHLKRWKKESYFFKKARKLFQVQVLHTAEPCDGSRVGVIVYRFVRRSLDLNFFVS